MKATLAPMMSSDRMDWETPASVFDPLDREFGFTLDVCATAENAKCTRFYSPKDNGLERSWDNETCWMNPPYGREIGKWIRKAAQSALHENATVVCLIPARTDTSYWHDYCMKGEIRFLRGRITFVGAPAPAPFPSAVVIFRPRQTHDLWIREMQDVLEEDSGLLDKDRERMRRGLP